MNFPTSNDNAVDNRVDRPQDNGGYPMSYRFEQPLSQSFSQVDSNEDRSLFLDPSPPTMLVERGRGASLGAGGEEMFVRKTAAGSRGKFKVSGGMKSERSRDLKLIKLMTEQGYLDLRQIAEFFFNGDKGNACRRVGQLAESRLVRKHIFRVLNVNVTLYCPTEGARKSYERAFGAPPKLLKNIVLPYVFHNLLVTDVRQRFTHFWDFRYQSEISLLAEHQALTPDGVLEFESTGHSVAIEVENSLKSNSRYGDLFRAYERSNYFMVIYVATHRNIYEHLKNLALTLTHEAPIGIFCWEDLREGTPKLWTPIGEIDVLERTGL